MLYFLKHKLDLQKVFLICCLLVLIGCFEKEEQKNSTITPEKTIHGGVYRFVIKYTPTTLDPIKIIDIYAEAVSNQIFEGLVQFGPYLEVLPCLAESWKIEEKGQLYSFRLKKDVLFHNGRVLVSEDVIFSLKRILRTSHSPVVLPHLLKIVGANGYRSKSRDSVSGLKIINDREFEIRLKTPHAPFLAALGACQSAIVPKQEFLEKDDFDRYPIGTGPFLLSSYSSDGSVELVRYDQYHGGAPFIDAIRYKTYANDSYSTIVQDFQDGLLEEIPIYKGAKEKLSGGDYEWFNRSSLSLMFYGMNVEHPNLKSAALREALSIVIDREKFVNEVWGGEYEAARTILPLGMPGYNPLKRVGNNEVEIARNLVKRSFLDKSLSIPKLELVSTVKAPIVDKEMAMVQNAWKSIGVDVEIKYITDWNEFSSYIKSDKLQMYRYAWYADMPDPDSFLYALFSSSSPNNFMQYQDEWVDTMLDKARGVVEPIKRIHMYQEIESRIMFSTPLIPLMYMNVNRVYQPYVKNINVCALGAHATTLRSVWLDKVSPSQ